MPTSDHRQISTVLDCVLRRDPRSVLDIGVGYGKYGTLLREYLGCDALISGVEPAADYVQPCAGGLWVPEESEGRWWAYDDVVVASWPAPFVNYDVALMIDVLEHFTAGDGSRAIDAALRAARAVVIATPHDPLRDDLAGDKGEWETHRSRWPLDELTTFPHRFYRLVEVHWLADSYVAVMEQTEEQAERAR